jgi:hypothetical protein
MLMLDFVLRAIQHEQPRTIASRSGMLRDEFRRQIEIEIGGPHGGRK